MNSETITSNIPLAGVVAFALASVWSLFQMFNNAALHPTWLYWIPACLVEIVTAWLMYQTVESVRKITRSNISDQDRRFHTILAIVCSVLSVPTLIVSVVANFYEFQGSIFLAPLFPFSCIACAVATAIPHIKERNVDERLSKEREKTRNERERVRKAKDEIKQHKTEIVQLKAELERISVEGAQLKTELEKPRTMNKPTPAIFRAICENLNGNKPSDARAVNKLLNDNGYYSVPDSTARTWAIAKE